MQIEITSEEAEVLALLLKEHCRELHFEIAHTDHREYKRSLLLRLELMESVLERITSKTARASVLEAA
jgi:hypothetical protein